MSKKSASESNIGLKRQLNPMHVWAIAFGCVIGWGSFINPGKKFLSNSGVAGTAIAMILGAAVMIIIAFSYAYMVPKYPKAGGEFTFTRMCFGKRMAFLCGWFLVSAYLTNVPMNSTAIALIIDGLTDHKGILNFGFHYTIAGNEIYLGQMLPAMAILLLFGWLNIIAHAGTSGVLSAILATFAIAPWAYVGFDAIPQAAEEFNFSFKKVSFIMIIAIVFGCFVYVSNNTVAAAALANWPDRVMAGEWVVLVAAEELLGSFGKVLIGLGVSCAVLSGIMGFYLASSRLMYSMSRDGYLPAWFGKVNRKYSTPRNAIVFCIAVSLSGPILGREALGWFVDMSAIGASIGYFFTCASTLITARRDGDASSFLKIMAVVGVVFSLAFMVLQLIPIPGLEGVHFGKESYIMLAVWTAMGVVFYAKQYKHFRKN